MHKCFWRFLTVAGLALSLAGCGSKESAETKQALDQATTLEGQKQYQDANSVLVDALHAREAKLRSAEPTPADPPAAEAVNKKVQADPEFLQMERLQIMLYLLLERADLASAVYKDVQAGNPGDTVIYDALGDKDPVVRTGAVRVLGLTGKPDAIPALIKTTKDDDKDVRRAAVAALGTIKDPNAIDPLLAALKDSYWFVRSEAAESLRQQGDPRAVPALFDALADSDTTVQSSAETALLKLCSLPGASADVFASHLNDANPKAVMISALGLAVKRDPRAVPVLQKLTASTDLQTRLQAIKGWGESDDPAALPTLRQMLSDPNVNVRGWCIMGLGNLKDTTSLPALRAMATDVVEPNSIQQAATAAINHITGQESAPAGP